MNEIRVNDGTWRDRHWRKSLKRISQEAQATLEEALVDLARDLAAARHPCLDPALQRWSPTPYRVPGRQKKQGNWYEYRLGDQQNKAPRAVVCHDVKEKTIYLVACTAIHDHRRMETLLEQF